MGNLFGALLGGLAGMQGGGGGVDGSATGGKDPQAVCGEVCPQGYSKVERGGNYVPSTNGCGTDGFNVEPTFPLTPCCDVHDRCYGTCGKSKMACDDDFQKCMRRVCEKVKGSAKGSCDGEAMIFNMGVRSLGCGPFRVSQELGCMCAHPTTGAVVDPKVERERKEAQAEIQRAKARANKQRRLKQQQGPLDVAEKEMEL